jgi:16S rRNA G966 N2-methylase RsmD
MKHLKINPELQRLIPPLTVDEFNQLEANILAEGIRESVIVWQDTIVDGHNRYQIAQRHNLEYDTSEMYFKSLDDCKEWMILNQFGRRNLSNYQRSVLALELEQVFRDKAKENLKLSEGRGKKGLHISANLIDKIDTRQELAKIASVSHDTIAKVKQIEAKAPEEVKEKLRTGEVSINQAYQEIKKEEKKEAKAEERRTLAEIGSKKTIEIDFRLGDFEFVFSDIPDGSVDCIITDPPYPHEFIDCWSKLSRVAKRILKPHGFCIAYSGQMYLPEVLQRM